MSLGDRFGHTGAVPGIWASLSTPEGVRARARLEVGRRATGVEDCRRVLSMLGLGFTDEEIAAVRTETADDTVIQAVSETGDLQ